MADYLIIRSPDENRIFTRDVAARLARITLDFLEQCEREELIRAERMMGGGKGYTPAEIQEMARIRRLQDDLGLEFPAVEVVVRMRRRMVNLLAEMEMLEQQMWQREEELRYEIQRLRHQLAEEGDFR